jgi:hypothetical protein
MQRAEIIQAFPVGTFHSTDAKIEVGPFADLQAKFDFTDLDYRNFERIGILSIIVGFPFIDPEHTLANRKVPEHRLESR